MNIPEQIEFNRPAKYTRLEILGNGACGETVRIRDEGMACEFVAKKYRPFIQEGDHPALYQELLNRFRDEARILFRLNHPNIVRVFNFFDYSEYRTAYIIMEYVAGNDVISFLATSPASANKVFEGVVDGFAHLQERRVLHRDIRPQNIMVDADGVAKIIDFGFGKQIDFEREEQNKSISLNLWCEAPPEFSNRVYDFQTEVYFVGKLFQLAIQECGLSDFKYRSLVREMCEPDRNKRLQGFLEVQNAIIQGKFSELNFSESEKEVYRQFAREAMGVVASIQSDAKIERDTVKILTKLEDLLRRTSLEEVLPAPNRLVSIFISGSFKFWKKSEFRVETLANFIRLLRSLSEEKRSIVMENFVMRLESVDRTEPNLDDEIPF